MATLFQREQMIDVLKNPPQSHTIGIGLYRQGYRSYGLDYWGLEIASEVKYFLNEVADLEMFPTATCIDIAAGTGKNILEFARLGIGQALAVEIDSIGASHLLNAVVALEEADLLPENCVSVVKDDALRFLEHHTQRYDIVVCYGLLHVFKGENSLVQAINLIKKVVKPTGYLILQAITNKYSAPSSQPELEGVIIDEQTFNQHFSQDFWHLVHSDQHDIEHSHSGTDENHRHGSIRAIYQRVSSTSLG